MRKAAQIKAVLFGVLLASSIIAHADDYTYTTNNGSITITGYTGVNCVQRRDWLARFFATKRNRLDQQHLLRCEALVLFRRPDISDNSPETHR